MKLAMSQLCKERPSCLTIDEVNATQTSLSQTLYLESVLTSLAKVISSVVQNA